ncbi:translation initiation factor eIF-2B subunit delta isoform X3 [Ctenocephalides felis]|nr:translation initiation factor eIF-2B subunit delta isoform X3 [Ctenocephalides felis]
MSDKVCNSVKIEKAREVMCEREVQKLAKSQLNNKVNKTECISTNVDKISNKIQNMSSNDSDTSAKKVEEVSSKLNNMSINARAEPSNGKSREEIKAEREAKKLAKQQAKNKKVNAGDNSAKSTDISKHVPNSAEATKDTDKAKKTILSKDEVDRAVLMNKSADIEKEKPEKSKAELRAERRAKQEAQRAAKLANVEKPPSEPPTNTQKITSKVTPDTEKAPKLNMKKKLSSPLQIQHKVKLFSHLYSEKNNVKNFSTMHPALVRLGEQFREGIVTGSNARCIAFINALKIVIRDYVTPPQKEFKRELESSLKPCMDYLHQCRPVSVSMTNALRFIKRQISQLPTNITDFEAKNKLETAIDVYYKEQICTAADAISGFVQNKIVDGDVILTFSCSSLIQQIFEDTSKNGIDFHVVVVDGRPSLEGREMLRRLIERGIKCSYVLINAVSFIMGEVTKVLLGAHALLANGYVMSRVGTAQIAMVAQSFNVPVLVCCETHKFIERVQTDSFVYNEIGNPESLISSTDAGPLCGWLDMPTLSPLNLRYDVTPPELVTAVVTELAILPCTSVPVILRIKPTEIGY